MYSNDEKKDEYENFIRSLGILPNHNYFEVTKGPNPMIFTYAKGSAFYEFFLAKQYLLVFTPSQIVMKKEEQQTPMILKHEEIRCFNARPLSLSSYHCISFKAVNKKFYFYIDADDVFLLGESSYANYNYYSLVEKNFYGLLK